MNLLCSRALLRSAGVVSGWQASPERSHASADIAASAHVDVERPELAAAARVPELKSQTVLRTQRAVLSATLE
jgi:hypothetical protein